MHLRTTRYLVLLALLAMGLGPLSVQARTRGRQSPQNETKKFDRVERFRGRFGELRTWAKATLKTTRQGQPKPTRELALAAISTIMIKTSMRVGCEAYTKREQSTKVLPSGKTKTIRPSFGASSLRKEPHVEVHGDKVRLHFWGKSGVYWDRTIQDADLARTVSLFLAQPGERLWQVPGKKRKLSKVTERHVEQLFHRYDAKPKDLRTMLANDLLQKKLGQLPRPTSKRQAERNLTQVVKEVADFMGHKPSTCRKSYLVPDSLEQYTAATGLR